MNDLNEKLYKIGFPLIYNNDLKLKSEQLINLQSTIKDLMESDYIKKIKSEKPLLALKLTFKNNNREIYYNLKDEKFYDEDKNEVIINEDNLNSYKIVSVSERTEFNTNSSELTLRDYIYSVRNVEALYNFRHIVTIDYNNDNYLIYFGKYGYVITDTNSIYYDDDYIMDKIVTEVKLDRYFKVN